MGRDSPLRGRKGRPRTARRAKETADRSGHSSRRPLPQGWISGPHNELWAPRSFQTKASGHVWALSLKPGGGVSGWGGREKMGAGRPYSDRHTRRGLNQCQSTPGSQVRNHLPRHRRTHRRGDSKGSRSRGFLQKENTGTFFSRSY